MFPTLLIRSDMGNRTSADDAATVVATPPNPHNVDQYVRFKILAELYMVSQFQVIFEDFFETRNAHLIFRQKRCVFCATAQIFRKCPKLLFLESCASKLPHNDAKCTFRKIKRI